MAEQTGIGTLIVRDPHVRGGRPTIAGTGVSVRRIVGWYKLGWTPDETVREFPHLNLAQVYAALAFYHLNKDEIEEDIADEERAADELERELKRGGAA